MSLLYRTLDAALTAGEVIARQAYWRIRARSGRREASRAARGRLLPTASPRELEDQLASLNVAGGLLMVHAALDRFRIADGSAPMPIGQAAMWLIEALRRALGDSGTLCMPTHPLYPDNPGFMFDKSDLVWCYSPRRTPSSVGLLSELFRRQAGTLRSRHPLSSLAAAGPNAEGLLHDNLNDRAPLPHGVDSGYFRFCQAGGVVISLGLGILKPLTILHVAEEVRDASWPVPGFFYRRQFEIEEQEGQRRRVVVRERRPEFVRGLALGKVRRDLLRAGILREGGISGLRCDVVDARRLLEFMSERQRSSTYPYYCPRWAAWGRPQRAKP
jgi:aminoglycoside 3-N-acetyltransferase